MQQGNPSLSSKPSGLGSSPLPPPNHPAYRAPAAPKAANKWLLHPSLPVDVRFLFVWTVVMSFASWSLYDELQVRSRQREAKRAEERKREKELVAAKSEVQHLREELDHQMASRGTGEASTSSPAEGKRDARTSWRKAETVPAAATTAAAVSDAPDDTPAPATEDASTLQASQDAAPSPTSTPDASDAVPAPSSSAESLSHPATSNLVTEILNEALVLERTIASDKEKAAAPASPSGPLEGPLTAAQLLERALEKGHTADPLSMVQARLDAEAISELVAKLETRHREALAAKDERAARLEEALDKSRRAVLGLRDRFREVLARAREELTAQHREDLRQELQKVRQELQEEYNRGAQDRLSTIDGLRTQVNALSKAFSLRSEERMQSHTAHKITTGVLALTSALDQGRPFSAELSVLQTAARSSNDPLLLAAVASLQSSLQAADEVQGAPVALKGLPTMTQLVDRFPDIRKAAVTLSVLPEGHRPGILTYGVAKLAALLKVSERASALLAAAPSSTVASAAGGGIDGTMARAERLLVEGKVSEAAQLVEAATRHTAAYVAIGPWLECLKARAVAEQTVELLKAHASVLSASLS